MTQIITLVAIIISTAISLFLLNGFITSKLKNKLSANEKPIGVSFFKALLFISLGLLFSELINTFNTLTNILPRQLEAGDLLLKEISFYCVFLGITLVIFIILFWTSTLLFSTLSKGGNIFVEIVNNNWNSLILFMAILLTFVLAVKTGISPLLDQFIPYPEMPVYR